MFSDGWATMQNGLYLTLLFASIGAFFALNAFLGPLGNTGVDGTLGAGLAVVGSIAAAVMIAVLALRPLSSTWRVTLIILAILAAGLTAVAAFFLMQTFLVIAMVLTVLMLVLVSFAGRRRSS